MGSSEGRLDLEGVVPAAVSLLDSALDYIASRARLEGFRLERRGRELAWRTAFFLGVAAVIGLGLVFASWGVAVALSEWFGWRPAGPLVLGAVYVAAGAAAALVASRRSA